MNRRGFLGKLIAATAAGVLVPEYLLDPPKGRSMVAVPDLGEETFFSNFTEGRHPWAPHGRDWLRRYNLPELDSVGARFARDEVFFKSTTEMDVAVRHSRALVYETVDGKFPSLGGRVEHAGRTYKIRSLDFDPSKPETVLGLVEIDDE